MRMHVISFNEYANIGTHWIGFYKKNNKLTYCHSFVVKHIPKKIRTFIGNKNIKANIS